ncbi:hypothetical protein GCM10025864_27490 [Luteimicrobium album]|uniref:Uncharacterized protein n=1 Tax=Luteimicrobium album TaxID=1054550 RepID=A0ABQ6I5C6_9MICO|nr:hypothetical protein GCM10025864_27490 [Luteimicrobium album]
MPLGVAVDDVVVQAEGGVEELEGDGELQGGLVLPASERAVGREQESGPQALPAADGVPDVVPERLGARTGGPRPRAGVVEPSLELGLDGGVERGAGSGREVTVGHVSLPPRAGARRAGRRATG